MSVRSPSGVSGSLTVSSPLETGMLSPVSADSPTSSVADSRMRPSAGTTSPASIDTTSPGTSCSAGSSMSWPPRCTFALMIIIFCSAATASAAFPSWRRPRTALKSVRKITTRPVASSCSGQMLPIPATSRTICIGSSYWRTKARQRGSVAATVKRFGPYSSNRAAATSAARPATASTSSSLATSSGGSVYQRSSGRLWRPGASTVVAIVSSLSLSADAIEHLRRCRHQPIVRAWLKDGVIQSG